MNPSNIYPRTGDAQTVYLNQVVTDPSILVGDYTMYHDFVHDPVDFEKNNVLYHYPVNHDRLVIGKFCSIACGAKFLFNSANHSLQSLSTYPFPIFFEEWGLDRSQVAKADPKAVFRGHNCHAVAAALVGLAGGADPGQSGCHSIRTTGSNQMTCFVVKFGLSLS